MVYTIAGSDSGGGAGIQADLHAIHGMGCHGCSAVTCLTAQNSCTVTAVHTPPSSFLREQLDALYSDMPPQAIKIGMIGSVEIAEEVGRFLNMLRDENCNIPVVVDPVMISTSGHRLIDEETQKAMIELIFPHASVLTPNKYEAEALLERQLTSPEEVENAAKDILKMGVNSVLIKGGHTLIEGKDASEKMASSPDVNATLGYAQDFFLSSEVVDEEKERLCDSASGVWLRSDRYESIHTHGTGCTLSSAIASALALGYQRRLQAMENANASTGTTKAIFEIDACCLGKAYVTQGIGRGVQIGKGPGPVVQTVFPHSSKHFPIVLGKSNLQNKSFLKMNDVRNLPEKISTSDKNETPMLGKILPIVDSIDWVKKIAVLNDVHDLQLRIKDETDPTKILDIVKTANLICESNGVRLWINDFWKAAIEAKCFGVHVGQEDLASCIKQGGLEKIRESNMALGISTHSYAELAVALGIRPSYISLGPVFGTTSKSVAFAPQGLATISKWRELIPIDCPLVAIGGINNADLTKQVKDAGASCVAVIGAVTKAKHIQDAVDSLNEAMA